MSALRNRFPNAGGGGGGGSAMLDPLKRLRKLDIYRKVPKDLTEGSALGGFVTTVSIIVLLMLTLAELRSLAQIKQETELVVDKSEDGAFRININVTVLGLSCEFLSVDLKTALGTVRQDLNDETLHKFATDSKGSWMGSATKKLAPAIIHRYDIPQGAKDHYGNERHAIELTTANFDQALKDYEVLLVDFHSPRCIHCVKFAPIYEIAAGLVKERSPGHGETIDSHRKLSVALGTVDCIENMALCRAQHIQAYPTVHVYRQTRQNKPNVDAPGADDKAYFQTKSEYLYEVYHGPREAEALTQFALKVIEEVLTSDPTLGKNAFVGPVTDTEGDGQSESTVHAAGCRVEGYLDVRRVPGQVIIRPHSRDNGHEFDTGLVNVDHRIDHLSFGHRVNRDTDDGAYSHTQVEKPVVLKDKEMIGFRAKEKGHAFMHFIKVVSRTIFPLGKHPVQAYEYSITSDSFPAEDKVPFISISFDLSPLQIRVVETRKNWVEGITAMLALIGGVFSSSFIIEALVSSFVVWAADTKRA